MSAAKRQKLQTLLDRISKDARTAEKLTKELYAEGFLFCESDHLYVMDGDSDGSCQERQEHIRMEGAGMCPIGGGAW